MPAPMTPSPKKPFNWGRFSKTLSFWILVILIPVAFLNYQGGRETQSPEIDYTAYRQQLDADNISLVVFQPDNVMTGQFRQPVRVSNREARKFTVRLVAGAANDEQKLLYSKGVRTSAEQARFSGMGLLITVLPYVLLIGFWIFLFRQMQAGGNKAFSFGKSKAKLLSGDTPKITFGDVAGADEAKVELQEIIEFLKDPQKYTKLGGRLPKGALLVGPPGTGKTLLAKAVAGEAGRPFFSMSGSDFVEMFVGVGASRVRDLFEQGKAHAPCIIFIDEIDAVGRHRGSGMGGGHDEREQTLNQLLVEMDGFESNDGVILIAATNRPDVLDPALLRPGRFDRRVVVNKPDLFGRRKILEVHVKKTPLSTDVDIERIARGTPGFAGADLENLVNEAALNAARTNKSKLTQEDFEHAKDKVMMGAERRSMVISDEEKKNTAYHEAGHTLVGKKLKGTDPIHKVTIIPRGMALGVTQTLPEKEQLSLSKSQAENMIAFLFGGRAAEELIFTDYTTGAGNDIERATEIARRMVCEWGMSEKLGPLAFEKREGPVFLGMNSGSTPQYSEAKAEQIDGEIYRIVSTGYEKAKSILCEHKDVLIRLADALLDLETIDGAEVETICVGGTLDDVKRTRSAKEKVMAVEQAQGLADEQAKTAEEQRRTDSGSSDPIGTPSPAGA